MDFNHTEDWHRNINTLRGLATTDNINDRYGQNEVTALHIVSATGKPSIECVRLCIRLGANVNARDNKGRTPLYSSIWFNDNDGIVKELLQSGADPNIHSDVGGKYPLHISVDCNDGEVARLLLEHGAAVDCIDNDGNTPLSMATARERLRESAVSKVLIDYGANTNMIRGRVPHWVQEIVATRLECRSTSTLLLGIHRSGITQVTALNDYNVLKLVGKHIWSMRLP